MTALSWYERDTLAALSARFGSNVILEPSEVDWDRRAVCRAMLPDGRRAVVKIDRDGKRHEREVAGLEAAFAAGTPVPEIVWSGHDRHWILVLAEVPTRRSMADGAMLWREAGAAVRILHSAEIPSDLPMFCDGGGDWVQHIEHRIHVECTAAMTRGLLSRTEAEAVQRYAAHALAAAGPMVPVLLHGDLQRRHLLVDDGRIVLIDFGDVGWGDPVLDLVVLTHFNTEWRDDVLDGYGADEAIRTRTRLLGPTYSLWRNLFVSRWYFENAFERHRNSAMARHVLDTQILPHGNHRASVTRLGCEAVLVDFDGLMVDTEFAGWQSWNELYGRYGRELPIVDWAERCGSDDPLSPWDELEKIAGVPLNREELEARRRERRDSMMTVLPGVHRFLANCRDNGLGLGLVSNSPMRWITRQIDSLGLDSNMFDLVLSGEGHRAKPAPDGYLLALEKLGVTADAAIAFEDSARGIAAAKAAGVRCVAVPNRVTMHDDLSQADLIVDSLENVEPIRRAKS